MVLTTVFVLVAMLTSLLWSAGQAGTVVQPQEAGLPTVGAVGPGRDLSLPARERAPLPAGRGRQRLRAALLGRRLQRGRLPKAAASEALWLQRQGVLLVSAVS